MGIFFRPGLQNCKPTLTSIAETNFIVTHDTEFNEDDIVWNWGGRTTIYGGKVWNPPENIINASDKKLCISILEELVPQTYDEYSDDIPVPFIGKKNFTFKGFGKRKFNRHNRFTRNRVGNYDILQEYLQIQQEYRILVLWNGKRFTLPRAYKKIVVDRNTNRPIFHPNWDFKKVELEELPHELKQNCIAAVQKLKLHLVGIDIAETNQGIKIFEVNTAPGLGINTARKIYNILEKNNGIPKEFE